MAKSAELVLNDVNLGSSAGVLQDITDLNLTVGNGDIVYFRYAIHCTTGNNIGTRFGVNGPSGTIAVGSLQPNTNTVSSYASITALNTVIFAETAGGNTIERMSIISGTYLATAPGTLSFQACNEGSGAMTLEAGSSALFEVEQTIINISVFEVVSISSGDDGSAVSVILSGPPVSAVDSSTVTEDVVVALNAPPPIATIQATESAGGTATGGVAVVDLPAGIVAGDLLLMMHREAGPGAIGWPAGWTELAQDSSDASDNVTGLAYRVATGSEGSTANVTQDNVRFTNIVYRINTVSPLFPPEISTVAVGTSTSVDPTVLAPSQGIKAYLWLWFGGGSSSRNSGPSTPTDYVGPVNNPAPNPLLQDNFNPAGCFVYSYKRVLIAASEDPEPSVVDSLTDIWTAWVVAIYPSDLHVVDSSTVTENVTVTLVTAVVGVSINVSDSSSLTEDVTVREYLPVFVQDSSTVTESVSVYVTRFPIVETTATTDGTTVVTPNVINLPAGIQAGDLLLVLYRAADTGFNLVWPAGWTKLTTNSEEQSDASDDSTSIAWRFADGSEAATISINPNASGSKFAAIVYRISGAANPTHLPLQRSTVAVGTSTTPDPGVLTPTTGAQDYLWLWLGGWEGEQTSPPATTPTNYTNPLGANSGTADVVTTNCRVASAQRRLNAASDDPGSWTISVSDNWMAWVVAVHPVNAIYISVFDISQFSFGEEFDPTYVTLAFSPLPIAVFDSSTVTEDVTVLLSGAATALSIDVSDTISVAESVTVTPNPWFITVSDASTATEDVTVREYLSVVVTDSSTLTEDVTVREYLPVSAEDTSIITEALTVTTNPFYIDASDPITLAESVTVQEYLPIEIDETVTLTELVAVTLNPVHVVVNDPSTLTELVQLALQPLLIAVSDDSTGTESVQVTFPVPGIAFDAATGSGGFAGQINIAHVPVGTPRGVLVLITQNVGVTDEVTSVTYGGVGLTQCASSPLLADAGTEDGTVAGWFRGTGIPTGNQTCTIDFNATGSVHVAVCFTVTASGDTEVEGVGSFNSSSIINPNFNIITGSGVETFVAGGIHSAFNDTGGLAAGSGYSEVQEFDYSAQAMSIIRRTAIATGGTVNVAWSSGVSVKNGGYGVAIKQTTAVGISINVFDSSTVTDDVTVREYLPVSAIDVSTLTEFISIAFTPLLIPVFDTATLSENVTVTTNPLYISVVETVTLAEDVTVAISVIGTLSINVSDSTALTENVTVREYLPVSAQDPSTVTETVTVTTNPLYVPVFEVVTLAEAVTVTPNPLYISIAETVTLSEVVSLKVNPLYISIAETITLAEVVTVTPNPLYISIAETVTLSEVVTVTTNPLYITVFETVTLTENVAVAISVIGTLSINVSDSSSLTEDVIVRKYLPVSVQDSSTITEAVTVTTNPLYISIAETVTLAEVVTVTTNPLYISISETVTLTEFVAVTVNPLQVAVFEAVTLAEAVTVTPNPLQISITEVVTLAEAVTVTTNPLYVVVSDTSTLSEVVTLRVNPLTINVFDAVTLTEFVNLTMVSSIAIDVQDSATLVEAVAAVLNPVNVTAVDPVALVEDVTVLERLPISVVDASTLTENVTVRTSLTIAVSDTSTVTEVVTVREYLQVVASDDSTVDEAVTLAFTPLLINVSDSSTIAETAAVTVGVVTGMAITVSENVVLAENVRVVLLLTITVSDSLTLDDFFQASTTLAVAVSDAVLLIDPPRVRTQYLGRSTGSSWG